MTRSAPLSLLLAVVACAGAGCDPSSPQAGSAAPDHAAPARTQLPARYDHDRLVLTPTTADGEQLEFFTDSGGGMDQLSSAAVARLRLPAERVDMPDLVQELGDAAKDTRSVAMPAFATGKGIPPVQATDGRLLVFPDAMVKQQWLPGMTVHDGFLGSRWFADRVWTWDYPGGRFFHEPDAYRPEAGAVAVPLAFRTDDAGKRVFSMPRMTVSVDGRDLPVLLDTGASTMLTPAALQDVGGGGSAERATSMVTDDVFLAWRKAHPQWRVVERAQAGTGSDMIEVPQVRIAGHVVGPVWFTRRPNASFHDMMSSMMDQRVEGAVGGNVFRHFVMTVDYPNAVAYFRCVVDCKAAGAPTPQPAP